MILRVALFCLLGGLCYATLTVANGRFAWSWLAGAVLAASFVPAVRFGPRGPLGQFGAIFLALVTIGLICTISEAVLFLPSTKANALRTLAGGTMMYFLFAAVLVLLAKMLRVSENAAQIVERRLVKIAIPLILLSGLAYVVYYLIFGAITYLYFTKRYYPHVQEAAAALGGWLWGIQFARGVLMTLGVLPIIYTLRMPRWQAAPAAGALLWVAGGGASLLVPNSFMVTAQRYIHIAEIMTQNMSLGITAVLLLRKRASIHEPAMGPGPPTATPRASINGIRLTFLEAGPADGPAVVLLHGFPEFSYSWRHQIAFLANAGFRVIAPDLRGYNTSDKPASVKNYRVEHLVADVIGFMDERLISKAVLVGHDWGGVIAWFVAMWHPGRIDKLVVLNAPHPAAYLRELRRPSQLLRSWYVLFFQLPWLPERMLRANHFASLRRLFRDGPARHGASHEADVDRYIEAVSQPGALTAMINYYRAAMRTTPSSIIRQIRAIHLPTLLIWGCRDRYLTPRLTDGLEQWVTDLRIERLPEATHWVQNDEPEKVNQILGEFLRNK